MTTWKKLEELEWKKICELNNHKTENYLKDNCLTTCMDVNNLKQTIDEQSIRINILEEKIQKLERTMKSFTYKLVALEETI